MRSLGLIETSGLVGAIEAADAAVKAADVVIMQMEYTDPAMVTVLLRGEVADVQAAVESGASAARRVGEVVSTHVIPNPHEEVEEIILPESVHTPSSPNAQGGVQEVESPKKKPVKKK